MADVAYLLHWPPGTMDPMELAELTRWQNLAVTRHNQVHAPPKQ
jgi:hypothetical protein